MLTPDEEARKAKLLRELRHLEAVERSRLPGGFARVKNPDDVAKLRRFQQIFGRYFPDLLENEHATIHLEQRLWDGIFGNPIQTINKGTFEADLKRFRDAIKVLSEWPIWGATLYFGNIPVVSQEFRDGENILHVAIEIYECLLMIGDVAHDKKLTEVLDQLESWARDTSEYLPDRRNINWEAVNAVDQLRGFWESWGEPRREAPRRALNPASPFADYLRDAFEFFEISGDPISAFKRWVVAEDFFRDVRMRKWK
jgi:hypothetical protein